MIRALLLTSLIFVILLSVGGSSRAQDPEPSWCVSVWYPSSEEPTGMDSIMNNLDVIDTVHPFWYNGLADGTILPTAVAEDADQLAAWREVGLKIIPSIRDGGFSQSIHDPAIREKHINEIIALIERMDYDGIDADYESFQLATRDNFSLFIEDLATALHAKGYLLTIAVHAKTDDAGMSEGAAAQDWARIAAAVDVFQIMTYDYHNSAGEAGPIGPPQWSYDVIAYAATITDLSKVRLGLHFYGLSWKRGNRAVSIPYSSVQRSIEAFDLAFTRDPADMEARLDFKAPGLPAQTIYVADAIGLEYKLDLIMEEFPELGGVAIWGIGGEDPANWGIIRDMQPASCKQA
ncbi:MAG: hypothetical protein DPW16_20900 [Chloroflexi bacterium]|nr:hypothetical protein [Chloroflexota bacterium]